MIAEAPPPGAAIVVGPVVAGTVAEDDPVRYRDMTVICNIFTLTEYFVL